MTRYKIWTILRITYVDEGVFKKFTIDQNGIIDQKSAIFGY